MSGAVLVDCRSDLVILRSGISDVILAVGLSESAGVILIRVVQNSRVVWFITTLVSAEMTWYRSHLSGPRLSDPVPDTT